MRTWRVRVALAWLVLAAALAGAPPAAAVTVVDMLGRRLDLARLPRRIVSLVPSATEIAFALGGEDHLVGVTDFCDFPPAARRKPSVGGMLAPSLESIVALRPDLVVATDEGNADGTRAQLERLGIPVYVIHANRLGEVMDVIARLGALMARSPVAGSLTERLQRRVEGVRAAVAPLSRRRVLYVLWPEPLIVPARAALVTELIEVAGGDSVTATEGGDYPRFSLEAAAARAPAVIVLARRGAGIGPAAREGWERLTALPAIRAGRVGEVDGDLLHRYGPRVVDGLEQLARVIHPEAFR